jgi:hypothetical protein
MYPRPGGARHASEDAIMDNRQTRTVLAFSNALSFFNSYPVKPEPRLLTGMCSSLRGSIERLQELQSEQMAARLAMNGSVEVRRRKLRREQMIPLVRIAKPLLKFAPGAESALRVPHARADAQTVAAAALRMADALTPHAKLLAAAGYSKEYLRDLRKEARALALTARTTEHARKRRSEVTATITDEFKKGMKTLMVIEGIVFREFAASPAIQRFWRNRRKVSARMGRPRDKTRARRGLAIVPDDRARSSGGVAS